MKPSKYRNKPTTVNGLRFASKAEANRYHQLDLMQRGGAISDLTIQERFPIRHNGYLIATYVADFTYMENGQKVIEDVKGKTAKLTAVFNLKRKMLRIMEGLEITVVRM